MKEITALILSVFVVFGCSESSSDILEASATENLAFDSVEVMDTTNEDLYYSQLGNYKIQFPDSVIQLTEVLDTPYGSLNTVTDLCTVGEQKVYLVKSTEYPADLFLDQPVEFRKELLQNGIRETKLRHSISDASIEMEMTLGEHMGYYYQIADTNRGIACWHILADNRLYQVLISALSAELSQEEIDSFVKSFKVLGNEEQN